MVSIYTPSPLPHTTFLPLYFKALASSNFGAGSSVWSSVFLIVSKRLYCSVCILLAKFKVLCFIGGFLCFDSLVRGPIWAGLAQWCAPDAEYRDQLVLTLQPCLAWRGGSYSGRPSLQWIIHPGTKGRLKAFGFYGKEGSSSISAKWSTMQPP